MVQNQFQIKVELTFLTLPDQHLNVFSAHCSNIKIVSRQDVTQIQYLYVQYAFCSFIYPTVTASYTVVIHVMYTTTLSSCGIFESTI